MSYRYRSQSTESSIASCGCGILLILFNLFIGGWSVNYLLQFFLAKTISFFGAMLIGLFAGELTVPTAIVIVLLRWFKVV
jgi:hypothetical protein